MKRIVLATTVAAASLLAVAPAAGAAPLNLGSTVVDVPTIEVAPQGGVIVHLPAANATMALPDLPGVIWDRSAAAPPAEGPVTPTGKPTAECKDGTLSYSQTHQGSCSGHGGVARWL